MRKAFNVALATALVHLYPPKHHQRALRILDDILKQDPNNADALVAHGYLLQHAEKWEQAETVFSRALELIPKNTPKCVRVAEESGWCLSRIKPEDGIHVLKEVLNDLEDDEYMLDRARCLWRIGKTCWDMGGEPQCFVFVMECLKANTLCCRLLP